MPQLQLETAKPQNNIHNQVKPSKFAELLFESNEDREEAIPLIDFSLLSLNNNTNNSSIIAPFQFKTPSPDDLRRDVVKTEVKTEVNKKVVKEKEKEKKEAVIEVKKEEKKKEAVIEVKTEVKQVKEDKIRLEMNTYKS